MRQVVFTVHGDPAPQGSKRHVGGGRMIEMSKKVGPWREAVKAAVFASEGTEPETFTGPVEVSLLFRLRRPQGHFGTGRNAGVVKPSAPPFPAVVPDLDKLERAMLDGLTQSGLIADDKLVVTLRSKKRYAEFLHPQCDVVVREAVE